MGYQRGEELCTCENSWPYPHLDSLQSSCTTMSFYSRFSKTLLIDLCKLTNPYYLTLFKCVSMWFFYFGWNSYIYLCIVIIKMLSSFMFLLYYARFTCIIPFIPQNKRTTVTVHILQREKLST